MKTLAEIAKYKINNKTEIKFSIVISDYFLPILSIRESISLFTDSFLLSENIALNIMKTQNTTTKQIAT